MGKDVEVEDVVEEVIKEKKMMVKGKDIMKKKMKELKREDEKIVEKGVKIKLM